VAVKTLVQAQPEDRDPALLAKFIGEARIGASVSDHPNIVRTLDLGLEGEHLFMVMELLEGRTLSQLARGLQLPVELMACVAVQVLSGLEHAQRAKGPDGLPLGLVHRDLKPSNLFVTLDGTVKIIDFGIALAPGMDVTTTRTGMIRGSISYLSPEQARGERPDPRSDLFSLGAVMHELLCGKRLFDQPSEASRLGAILYSDYPSVRSVRPELPAAVDEAVMWALKRDAARRPQTARELSEALVRALAPAQPWTHAQFATWVAERIAALPELKPEPKSDVSAPPRASPPSQPQAVPAPEPLPAPRASPPPAAAPAPAAPEPGVPPAVKLGIAAAALLVVGAVAFGLMAEPAAPPAPRPLAGAKPAPPPPKPREPAPAIAAPAPAPAEQPVPAPKAAPPPPPKVQPAAATPKPAPAAPAKPAALVHVTIDSRPTWATVSVDGKELGPTPLVRVPLAVGMHQLTAVSSDGKRKAQRLKLTEGNDDKVLLEW